MIKAYDADLDCNSKPAEWAVLSWLFDAGFTVTDHPQGDKGPDIHVARFGKVLEEYIVEVEHMGPDRTYDNGDLRYSTLSVLARRKVSDKLPTLIFHVTNDMKHALIVFDRDFRCTPSNAGCVSRNNSFGEPKKYVPVERILKVRIGTKLDQPFAEINADRVRDAIENEQDIERVRRYLSPVRPYGMSGVEWRHLLERLSSGWAKPEPDEIPF